MKQVLLIMGLAITILASAQDLGVTLHFSPASERFAEATQEYQRIWLAEGKKIIEAMETVSGLKFLEKDIQVTVFEGVSRAGSVGSPMKLRASYPADVKKATLIHELGHRLDFQLAKRPPDIDEHRLLYLYLYDVWVKLYGQSFADEQVAIEKQRKGIYDYESAWQWALTLKQEARAARLKEIIRENQ
jgi:hypothetical protein